MSDFVIIGYIGKRRSYLHQHDPEALVDGEPMLEYWHLLHDTCKPVYAAKEDLESFAWAFA